MRCLHPKRRVSQPFGIAVNDGDPVRPPSCTAMFLTAFIKIPAARLPVLAHGELFDGAGCGLQVIWKIPEALRRE